MTTLPKRFFEKVLYFSSLAPSMHAVCHSQLNFLHITTKYRVKHTDCNSPNMGHLLCPYLT